MKLGGFYVTINQSIFLLGLQMWIVTPRIKLLLEGF